MRKLDCVVLLAVGVLVAGASEASAQSSGLFGDRSLGGSGLSAGNRTFSSGAPGSRTTTADETVGQLSGNEDFVRATSREQRDSGTRQFVGSDTSDMNNFMSAMQEMRGGNAGGGLSGLGNAGRRPGGANQPGARAGAGGMAREQVRTSLTLGFRPLGPQLDPRGFDQRGIVLTKVLQRSSRVQIIAPVEVAIEGQTAILRGTVASQHDRVLAEQLVRLEPGIWNVKNELVVAESSDAPTPRLAPAVEVEQGSE
ncbi:MAG: BON domain-containing protein [Planctomycetes bacterium]|nr:BON domain-containing protein [Planctomycetota bacterium]